MIGGGVGRSPDVSSGENLLAEGKSSSSFSALTQSDEIFYAEEFEKLGVEVHIATADGSVGTKGFVTDVVKPFLITPISIPVAPNQC